MWKAERWERTALSSCDAEIRATNMSSLCLSDYQYTKHDFAPG